MSSSRTEALTPIAERSAPAPEQFRAKIASSPAAARISMVHGTAPDMHRLTRSAPAHAAAQAAELVPGDAIFIPRNGFHHVEAIEALQRAREFLVGCDEFLKGGF